MRKNIVLDSYALVCLFHKEHGWETVQKCLRDCESSRIKALLSIINWGEFYYIIKRRVGSEKSVEALSLLEQMPVEILSVDAALVRRAADIKSDYAISYADSFCIATALYGQAKILTGDPEFKQVEKLVEISWVG